LPTTRLLALMFLIVAHAAAQNGMATETRSGMHDEISSTGGGSFNPAPPVVLPETPAPRVIDKKFIALMGTLGGAESLRFTTRKLVLDNEFAAGAPWVTSVYANQHLVARYAGLYAAELLVAYEIKKPHSWLPGDNVIRKLWWAYPAAMAIIDIKNAVGNIRTQAPSGCPVPQCSLQ
jgi:hypothetical protein